MFLDVIIFINFSLIALHCSDNWEEFGHSCYKVFEEYRYSRKADWLTAERVCFGFGGNLVSIENGKQKNFVNNLSSEFKNDSVWIGLVHMSHKGGYLWSDGTPFNSSVVYSQPCNRSNISCVEIIRNGWNFTKCRKENSYYICKRPKGE